MTKAIPEGYRSVTPNFTFKDCHKAIEFYKKAFGAKAISLFPSLDGKGVMHATIQIGDCILMMGDEMAEGGSKSAESLGHSPISLYIYDQDADALFRNAVSSGATVVMPMEDMFWGDRCGSVKDPFGFSWMIGTHKFDLSKEEMRKGAEAFFSKIAKK